MNPLRSLGFLRRKAAASTVMPAQSTLSAGSSTNQAVSQTLTTAPTIGGVRALPRPALRWLGPAGRIALRSFDFAADADAVCAFQQDTYTLNFPDFRYTDDFATAFRHDLRRAALDSSHAIYVLDEGRIVGFLWLVLCENSWTRERYGYVNNLYVVPERRGLGLAHEMMNHSDAVFRSRRIHRVRLTVTVANAEAIHLYEHCGFHAERWEMEKILDP
jgi:ribosomal protein S18 acetylase RimI-like enzyme